MTNQFAMVINTQGPPREIFEDPIFLDEGIWNCLNGLQIEGTPKYDSVNNLHSFSVTRSELIKAIEEQKKGDLLAKGLAALLAQHQLDYFSFTGRAIKA